MLSNTDSLMFTSLLHLASTRCGIHRCAPPHTLYSSSGYTITILSNILKRKVYVGAPPANLRELRDHVSRAVRLVRHNRDRVNQTVVESTREGAQRCIAQGGGQVEGRGDILNFQYRLT